MIIKRIYKKENMEKSFFCQFIFRIFLRNTPNIIQQYDLSVSLINDSFSLKCLTDKFLEQNGVSIEKVANNDLNNGIIFRLFKNKLIDLFINENEIMKKYYLSYKELNTQIQKIPDVLKIDLKNQFFKHSSYPFSPFDMFKSTIFHGKNIVSYHSLIKQNDILNIYCHNYNLIITYKVFMENGKEIYSEEVVTKNDKIIESIELLIKKNRLKTIL